MAAGHILWDIGRARLRQPGLLALLDRVLDDARAEPDHGGIGLADRGYARLAEFQSAMAALRPEAVDTVAPPTAGQALRAIEAALVGLRRANGMGAGPDRDLDGARRMARRLEAAVTGMRGDLARFGASVAGLACPEALPARTPATPAPAPVRTVPRVPVPRPREATSAMARVVLGEVYGTLAVAHVEARAEGGVGRAIRHDLDALSGRLGAWSDAVAYRAASADEPFVDAVARVGEALDNALDSAMSGRTATVGHAEALGRCLDLACDALRRVDRFRAALGHVDLSDEIGLGAETAPGP